MQQNYVCFYSPAFALSRAKRHVRIDIMIHRTTTADHKCCAPLILKNVYELLSFEHHDVLNYNYSITALPCSYTRYYSIHLLCTCTLKTNTITKLTVNVCINHSLQLGSHCCTLWYCARISEHALRCHVLN